MYLRLYLAALWIQDRITEPLFGVGTWPVLLVYRLECWSWRKHQERKW